MKKISALSLGILLAMVVIAGGPAAADPAGSASDRPVWEEVEIEPCDSTQCEFVAGVFTEYEVDATTLPQYDRRKVTTRTEKDWTERTHYQFERPGIQFNKVSEGPGPEILIEQQRANVTIVGTMSVESSITIVEWTEDGDLVDRNRQTLSGTDVVKETGVCRPSPPVREMQFFQNVDKSVSVGPVVLWFRTSEHDVSGHRHLWGVLHDQEIMVRAMELPLHAANMHRVNPG